jgi:hypothetical protein
MTSNKSACVLNNNCFIVVSKNDTYFPLQFYLQCKNKRLCPSVTGKKNKNEQLMHLIGYLHSVLGALQCRLIHELEIIFFFSHNYIEIN